MYASKYQLEEFFNSMVWRDIQDILNNDLSKGLDLLVSPELNEVAHINYCRGKIEVLKEVLALEDKMIEAIEMENEALEEEVV